MKFFLFKDQQEKAQLYFVLILLINIAVLSVIVTGIVIGIKGYISDTKFAYKAVTCCGSICSKCLFTLRTLYTLLPWICIVILSIGTYMAIHKAFFMISWNYFLVRSCTFLSIENYTKLKIFLSGMHSYNQPVLLDNDKLLCAFTSGLWKPKIYLSTGVCSYLTTKELLAVILHETYHKKNNAPLKQFILQILYALNFFLPINHYLVNLYSSTSEKAADDTAIKISGEPLELASALVKLSKSNITDILHPLVAFSRGQSSVEDRLRRLLEPQAAVPYFGKTNLYLSCLLSFFIAATICLPLFCKSLVSIHTMGCKTKICHMTACG